MYSDGETVDREIWAEMRSNVLMVSGDHYHKKNWKILNALRDVSNLSEDQKLRITKNHTHRIYKTYVNRIVSMAPDTAITPQNEKELPDTKAAELHHAVWLDIKKKASFKEKVNQFASDYVGIGEVWAKVYWDWNKGNLKSEEKDPETGDTKTTFSGGLCWDRVFGFNVFRPKGCMDLKTAPWLGIRSMESVENLKARYSEDEVKMKLLEPDGKTTFLVFDQNSGEYTEAKDTVLVKEIYYRPSPEHPRGYYYYFVSGGILEEGELPGGLFPLVYSGFDEIPTQARYRSPIKQWKPYQVEINRMSSKMAEHQVTLGDDKVIIMNGGKLGPGGNAPGVRALSASGGAINVIPGRTGEQYLNVLNATISDYYQTAMVSEELEDKLPANVDPYAMLLSSSRWKARFSLNIQKFERFLLEATELALEMTRLYIEEDELINVIGKGEAANIPEFKNSKSLLYQITLEESTEDVESRVGKKLALDRYIQYAGANMKREDIGKFLRMDPYLAKEQIFSDFTMPYDNATNDILALDRGQQAQMNRFRYPEIGYILQRLTSRMGMSDFNLMPPQVQQNYEATVNYYQQQLTQMTQEQAALDSEFIPTDGPLVRCDFWVPDPKSPDKQVRLAMPSASLLWLWDRIQKQGSTMDVLHQQQQTLVSGVAQQLRQNQAAQQAQQAQQQAPAQGQLPAYAARFFNAIKQAQAGPPAP